MTNTYGMSQEALQAYVGAMGMPDLADEILEVQALPEPTPPKHPAKFSAQLMPAIAGLLEKHLQLDHPFNAMILDPFAGVGGIHRLRDLGPYATFGVELEEPWAQQSAFEVPDVLASKNSPRKITLNYTEVGNALNLRYYDESFDAIITSPSYGNRMADHHVARDGSHRRTYRHYLGRELSADNSGAMQWGCVAPGTPILRSDLRWVPVETLRPGEELLAPEEDVPPDPKNARRGRRLVLSQVEHVELAPRSCVELSFHDGTKVICTEDHPWLARRAPGPAGRNRTLDWIEADQLRPSDELPVYFEDWERCETHDAGWLAGMFDGEGSTVKGNLQMAQRPGAVLDRACAITADNGFDFSVYVAKEGGSVSNLCLRGGQSEIARFLGTFRPERLVKRFAETWPGIHLRSLSSRIVTSVRYVGLQDVVLMGTSSHTYFANGFGSHNTEYRSFHSRVWNEVERVLAPGGLFILNIKDHPREKRRAHVSNWHYMCLRSLGLKLVDVMRVTTPSYRFGENREVRYPERLLVFRKASKDAVRIFSRPHDPSMVFDTVPPGLSEAA